MVEDAAASYMHEEDTASLGYEDSDHGRNIAGGDSNRYIRTHKL